MGENEVTDDVCSLDRVRVGVESLKEPWVLFGDEVSGHLICPEYILVLWVEVDTALLTLLPDVWDIVRLVRLMDDFRDQLGLGLQVVGVVQLCREEAVLAGVIVKQRNEVKELVREEERQEGVCIEQDLDFCFELHGVVVLVVEMTILV